MLIIIRLSEAENVVLIGHGTGCGAIMELINHRGKSYLLEIKRRKYHADSAYRG